MARKVTEQRITPPDPTPAQIAAKSRKMKKASPEARVAAVKAVREKLEKKPNASKTTVARTVNKALAEPPVTTVPEQLARSKADKMTVYPGIAPAGTRLWHRQTSTLYYLIVKVKDDKPRTAFECGVDDGICQGLVKLGLLEEHEGQGYTPTALARESRDHFLTTYGQTLRGETAAVVKEIEKKERKVRAKKADGEETYSPLVNPGPKPRTFGKLPPTMKIKALAKANPSREGTKAHGYFELIKKGGTVADYVVAGGSQNYLVWFIDRHMATAWD